MNLVFSHSCLRFVSSKTFENLNFSFYILKDVGIVFGKKWITDWKKIIYSSEIDGNKNKKYYCKKIKINLKERIQKKLKKIFCSVFNQVFIGSLSHYIWDKNHLLKTMMFLRETSLFCNFLGIFVDIDNNDLMKAHEVNKKKVIFTYIFVIDLLKFFCGTYVNFEVSKVELKDNFYQ